MRTLYFGGEIITMTGEGETAQALVEDQGRILYVGGLEAAEKYCDGQTRRADLQGRVLMPSFIDPHGHISMVMQFTDLADLSSCTSFDDIVDTLRAYIDQRRPGPEDVVMGVGYDHNFLEEQAHPTKRELDRVSDSIPIYVAHTSFHMGCANSALLRLAGLGNETPDPPGGRYGRLDNGRELSGYAEEGSAMMSLLQPVYSRLKSDPQKQIRLAQEEYLKYGITTVQDGAASAANVGQLAALAEEGLLDLDVVSYVMVNDRPLELIKQYAQYEKKYKSHFKIGGLKMVLDGSPQGKSAWLTQPYEGEGEYRGYPALSREQTEAFAKLAVDSGHQLLCHCNGDAASQQFLQSYEKALSGSGHPEKDRLRPVMIHCQTVRDDQLDAMARISMIPSIFVAHTYYWGDVHLKNLGQERGSHISPAKSAFDRGLKVNFHQDAPVIKPDMLQTVWCAVNRITRKGRVIGPDQRVSVYQALEAVTVNGAYAYFEEDRKGTLEAGKLADMVVLDRNPLKVEPLRLRDIRVMETIKEGKVLYSAES